MKRKILLYAMILNLFTMNVWATNMQPDVNETQILTETEEESSVSETSENEMDDESDDEIYDEYTEIGMINESGDELVYTDGSIHVFYNTDLNYYYDETGSIDENTLSELGIINPDTGEVFETVPESLAATVPITINVKAEFEGFDVMESDIYTVDIEIDGEYRYIREEEISTDYGNITLTRDNDFTDSITIDCIDNEVYLIGSIPSDITNIYRLHFNDEDSPFKVLTPNQTQYDLTLYINILDGAITDTNLAPTLSEDDKKYMNGEYGESLRAELEESLGINETEPESAEEENTNAVFISVVVIVLIFILIIVGILYIRRLQKDDDDD